MRADVLSFYIMVHKMFHLLQVIVLDTDVFFLTDIAELWEYFHNFTKDQVGALFLANYS